MSNIPNATNSRGHGPIDPANNLVTLEIAALAVTSAQMPFKRVSIHQSIEKIAGSFSIDVSGGWNQAFENAIYKGMSATIRIGNEVLVTGYMDRVGIDITPTSHAIELDGRDKTGDLVDCSAPPREWVGMSFEHVATELCKPYGIELYRQVQTGPAGYITPDPTAEPCPIVKCDNGGDKLPRKATNTGETVHRTLEKLAKIQGVLLISDGKGGLIVTRAGLGGRADDVLAMGYNIKSIKLDESFMGLYSEITVKGQANGATSTAAGSQTFTSVQTVKPSATVKRQEPAKGVSVVDTASSTKNASTVGRYRPLIITADSQADAKRCADRAAWEIGVREAKSKRITVVVQGWRQRDGSLWRINTLVRLKCPWVREDEDMLIASCEYKLDASGGTTTQIELVPPMAYDVLREIPTPKAVTASSGKGKANTFSNVYPRGAQAR